MKIKRILSGCIILILAFAGANAHAQETPDRDTLYRVELHLEMGPMLSDFYRGRALPTGANNFTSGYNAMVRLMWHPDHLLAVGILTGYQQLVSEKFSIADSNSNGNVSASLHALPVMIDVSMQGEVLEFGVGLGGYSISTTLTDKTVTHSSRLELGAILHAAYHWHLTENLAIGAEVIAGVMSYRGIFSVAPQIDLKYNLFTY